ncbi:MAG: prolyl oligopeptidase family serine peptidase [Planctomycetota bacterium]|nr:prolyl oligopeptidase family serine peptidase [Planctomycetota bacterium]
MKHKLPAALLVLLSLTQTIHAADTDFSPHVYTDADGQNLPYRLLKPDGYDTAKGASPLLIFLHGAGERGTDNRAQLVHGKPFMRRAAAEHGCFVLVPQCPKEMMWAGRHWADKNHGLSEKPSQPIRRLMGLIEKVQKTYRIDSDRIYVMGLSMGGFGTWEMIQRQPKRFAAAVPICGGGDEALTKPIVAVPIWAFHGDKDGVVPAARTRDMIAGIKKAGGKPKYTEYPGVGHNSWTPAFKEAGLLKWICAQKKP